MIKGNFVLHVVHVAGTRMIGEGTDGLSRGEVMASNLLDKFAHHVPLDLPALSRSTKLKGWLDGWLDLEYKVATPVDWYWKAQHLCDFSFPQKQQTWVWDIPPAAAPYVPDELVMARNKRHEVMRGVVLIPCLMKPYWFRRFTRAMDFYFVIPTGSSIWGLENHEPVYVGVYLPLLNYRPWEWRRVPFLVGFARTLSTLHKTDFANGWDLLRQFWRAALWIQNMPESLVSGVLSDPGYHKFLGVAGKRSCNRP
jgi:hypothetical protein